MLVIRLRRVGKKNKPSYRIVVAEHSFPIDGRFVEDLGFYNPHTKTAGIDKDKAVDWMKKGAKPSNTIAKILEKEKVKHSSVVVEKKNKKPKAKSAEPKAAAAAPAAEAESPVADAPVESAETVETPEAVTEEATAEAPAEEPASEEALAEEPAVEAPSEEEKSDS